MRQAGHGAPQRVNIQRFLKTPMTTRPWASHPTPPHLTSDFAAKELPVDPVLAADGKIYERAKIEEWLATSDTSPVTGEKMKDAVLTAASSVVTGAIDFLVKCNAVDEQKKEAL